MERENNKVNAIRRGLLANENVGVGIQRRALMREEASKQLKKDQGNLVELAAMQSQALSANVEAKNAKRNF